VQSLAASKAKVGRGARDRRAVERGEGGSGALKRFQDSLVVVEWTLTFRWVVGWLQAMLDQTSQPASQPHVIGEGYDFNVVRAHLGGEPTPPHFAIHRKGAIVGLCLGLSWHPRAEADPCEVWIGRKGDAAKWGTKLAETSGPIPVYVRRDEGGEWFFIGWREVTGSTREPDDIRPRLKPPTITAIARVVTMRRVPQP